MRRFAIVALLTTWCGWSGCSAPIDSTPNPLAAVPPSLNGAQVVPLRGAVVEGTVVDVRDGDTLELSVHPEFLVVVRLAEIDAPELRQPFGLEARGELSKFVLGKWVRVEIVDTDAWRRSVARVYVDDLWVNRALVEEGAAWVYARYVKDEETLFDVEARARAARLGLWAEDDPTPPWEFRERAPRG